MLSILFCSALLITVKKNAEGLCISKKFLGANHQVFKVSSYYSFFKTLVSKFFYDQPLELLMRQKEGEKEVLKTDL